MNGNPVEQIRQLNTRKGRQHFGHFVIEGARVVERALRALAEITQLVVGVSFAEQDERGAEIVGLAVSAEIPITTIIDEEARELSDGRKLGAVFGVVAMGDQVGLATVAAKKKPVVLALIDVVEPGNVGAMIRTAHGLGVAAVLTCGRSDAWHPKAVRTAMGSLFKLPVIHFDSAELLLAELATHQIEAVGTVSEGGELPSEVVVGEKGVALLMGNEFYGISAEISAACDQRVTIPMIDGIDSFSVAAAAAIALYAAANEAT